MYVCAALIGVPLPRGAFAPAAISACISAELMADRIAELERQLAEAKRMAALEAESATIKQQQLSPQPQAAQHQQLLSLLELVEILELIIVLVNLLCWLQLLVLLLLP